MSLVMPLLPPAAAPYRGAASSRSSTPGGFRASSPTPPASARLHSRPATPPIGAQSTVPAHLLGSTLAHHLHALHTISAPPTPVNTTHLIPLPAVPPPPPGVLAPGMERCRSSEAVLSHAHTHNHAVTHVPFTRDDTATSRMGSNSVSNQSTPRKTPQPLLSSPPSRDQQLPPADIPASSEVSSPESHEAGITPTDESEELTDEHFDTQLEVPDGTPQLAPQTAEVDLDDRMDIDEVEVPIPELGAPTSDDAAVWGMPKWGLEAERPEVRPGVRLVGMEELPGLIERHSLLDTPSQVLFPWLHGISDDGVKGREMGAFFGYGPPFEPPPFRGLTLMLSPLHPLDRAPLSTSPSATGSIPLPATTTTHLDIPGASSLSSDQYNSNHSEASPGTETESLMVQTPSSPGKLDMGLVVVTEADADKSDIEVTESDVAMHPCQSKSSPRTVPSPIPAPQSQLISNPITEDSSDSDSDSYFSEEEERPNSILLNSVHAQDVFDLPMFSSQPGRRPTNARVSCPASPGGTRPAGRFRPARLPNQINLRNLHIQQIKYATISDIVLYARNGVGPGLLEVAEAIANAQDELYRQRMDEFYVDAIGRGEGEGLDRPVKYGVWVVVEPFSKIERFCPEFVNISSEGTHTSNSKLVDLFEREAHESRVMTRGCEVLEGFWVGNDTDVPGGSDDGAGASVHFDLCIKASECSDMPSTAALSVAYRQLLALDRLKQQQQQNNGQEDSWSSPAAVALRNLLSSGAQAQVNEQRSAALATSPDESHIFAQQHAVENRYVAIECAGSCRTITGQMRSMATMTDKVLELVAFIRKLVEGRDKTGIKRTVLLHCQDGYTESSILALSYVMAVQGVSLPEAYRVLQLEAKRSFFLYPTDKPLLRRIEAHLAQERRDRAIKTVRGGTSSNSTSPTSSPTAASTRWKPWGFIRSGPLEDKRSSGGSDSSVGKAPSMQAVDAARRLLNEEAAGGSPTSQDAKIWFEDKRFDGFPSRILPFLYLGNLEHAGNAFMLKSLGITHVVSVGETLLDVPPDHDPLHGYVGPNSLSGEARAGRIQVLDLTDVRDDGNDPLRPVIARACEWMEQARLAGGGVLVHCRVGVSRSASIVMAYLMKYRHMGLMDAYLMTRARRLNVLIQPNLRFFHELFGWEAELAREEEDERRRRRREAERMGVRDPVELQLLDNEIPKRRILYSWPTFCRDVHCLNRRFLCN